MVTIFLFSWFNVLYWQLFRQFIKRNQSSMLLSACRQPIFGPLRFAVHSPTSKRSISTFQTVADTFLSLHESTNLPWLILVPLSTFALRTVVTLPLSIWQRKRIVKQQELRKLVQAVPPVVKLRLAAATNAATKVLIGQSDSLTSSGSVSSAAKESAENAIKPRKHVLTPEQITLLSLKETRNRQKKLFAKYDVQMWKNMVLPLVQIPLWVTVSMGLRELTETKLVDTNLRSVSPLVDANTLDIMTWVSSLDLSLPVDLLPMMVPMALGTLAMINVEYNGRMMTTTTTSASGIETANNSGSKLSQSLKSILNVSRLSCIFLMGVSSQASVLLSLYWISSQLYSLLQNLVLDWLWPYQR